MSSQGANNGPSQGAGSQFVKFSRGAAQRIAKAVRTVEAGDRTAPGVTFDHPVDNGLRLKVATFTGSWATGTWKTVTLNGSTQTASVYNWCNAVTGNTATTADRYVIFGKASGTNSVVEIAMGDTCGMSFGGMDLKQVQGYNESNVQVLGHNTTGPCLQWYSVTTCATA